MPVNIGSEYFIIILKLENKFENLSSKTQKTDYTYSKLSPHRRHLQQGEIAMPNMSRKSLEQHHERVNMMVARNPEQEEFIRRRYEQIDYARLRNNRDINLAYDSHDELDVVESEIKKRYTRNNHHSQYQYNRYESESWITRFVSRVVTIFYNFVGIFISSKDEEYSSTYSNRIPEQQGEFLHLLLSCNIFRFFRCHIKNFLVNQKCLC